jgi:futalosine hydrolase
VRNTIELKIFAKLMLRKVKSMIAANTGYLPMQILVVSATEQEIKPAIPFFLKNKIDVLIAGIGGVATTHSLNRYCHKNRPGVIIQAGVGGCFNENKLGEVFVIKEEIFADLGVWENKVFKTIFDLQLENRNTFPFKKGMLINPNKKLLGITSPKKVSGISVNEITTDKKRITWYKQNFSPVVESMEGAALHYVCLQQEIPFVQIRAISNYVGERNKSKWKMKEAIHNLNEELIFLLTALSNYNETDFGV